MKFVGRYGRNTFLCSDRFLCSHNDWTGAFYVTYNYTINGYCRSGCNLSCFFRERLLGKDCPAFAFQVPCMTAGIRTSIFVAKKKE